MHFHTPTVADFKERFNGDFPYGDDQTRDDIARDKEISWALEQAGCKWAPSMLNQKNLKEAYLLLAAHCLVLRLRQRASGFFSNWEWQTIQNVGGAVSHQYQMPADVKDDAFAQWLASTRYGIDYFMQIYENRFLRVFYVPGATTP